MTKQSANKESRELSLGDDFGPAVVSVNGITLMIDADGRPTLKASGDATIITNGNITAYSTDGNVTAYTNGTVQLKAPAPEQTNGTNATVTKQAYNIGDVLPDGWIVGPVSPDTDIVMSIEPVSGALDDYKTWHQGEKRAAELCGKGNANARQPSDNELNALYNDVVKAGRNNNAQFNTSGSVPYGPYGAYWSSTTGPSSRVIARVQYLDDGNRVWDYKNNVAACVRCVRDESGITLK